MLRSRLSRSELAARAYALSERKKPGSEDAKPEKGPEGPGSAVNSTSHDEARKIWQLQEFLEKRSA
jgi:hypothetical protein